MHQPAHDGHQTDLRVGGDDHDRGDPDGDGDGVAWSACSVSPAMAPTRTSVDDALAASLPPLGMLANNAGITSPTPFLRGGR